MDKCEIYMILIGSIVIYRLLIAIRTEISDNVEMAPSEVETEPTIPINETAYARNEEFFLFATIMDVTIIDKKLGDKPVYFEISIGNAGNALDGHNESFKVNDLTRSHFIRKVCHFFIQNLISPSIERSRKKVNSSH